MVSEDYFFRHWKNRAFNHSRAPTSADISRNELGQMAEFEFAKLSGIMPDIADRPNGDGGVDFFVPVRMSVDVKTTSTPNPSYLLVESAKVNADIYVLFARTRPIGWATAETVKSFPVSVLKRGPSHFVPVERLRPLSELLNRIPA